MTTLYMNDKKVRLDMAVNQPRDKMGKWTNIPGIAVSGAFPLSARPGGKLPPMSQSEASNALASVLENKQRMNLHPDARYQLDNDPDSRSLLKSSQRFHYNDITPQPQINKVYDKKQFGREGECHWNASKMYEAGHIDAIVIGYATAQSGYTFQHTWGLKNGKVVDTTPGYNTRSNTGYLVSYYGKVLSPAQSSAFASHCSKNPPGKGMVRTLKGGSIETL